MNRFNQSMTFFIAFFLFSMPVHIFSKGSGTYSFNYFGNTKGQKDVYYKEHFVAYETSANNWSYYIDFRGQSQEVPQNTFITLKDNFQVKSYVSYEKDPYFFKFGHFYATLGRGLVFNGFENRDFRLDKNTLGLYGEYDGDRWRLKAFKGGLNSSSIKKNRVPIMGSEISYQFSDSTAIGGTIVSVEDSSYEYSVHSGFVDIAEDDQSLYLEYAKSNDVGTFLYGDDDNQSYAFYAAHELSINEAVLTSQYKNYYHFELNFSNEEFLNQLPTVLKEHNYTLISRSQSDLDFSTGNDEKGYLIELDVPVQDDFNTHFSYGMVTTTTDSPKFQEYYAEIDYNTLESFDIVYGLGLQEKPHFSNVNHIVDTTYSLSDSQHIQGIFEYQNAQTLTNEIVNLGYTLKYIPSSDFSVGFVFETTDEIVDGERSDWFGTQIDFKLSQRSEFSLFYGARKAGKSCIGGVCINKPEFNGLEIAYSAQF